MTTTQQLSVLNAIIVVRLAQIPQVASLVIALFIEFSIYRINTAYVTSSSMMITPMRHAWLVAISAQHALIVPRVSLVKLLNSVTYQSVSVLVETVIMIPMQTYNYALLAIILAPLA
jgi:hypothetical protein